MCNRHALYTAASIVVGRDHPQFRFWRRWNKKERQREGEDFFSVKQIKRSIITSNHFGHNSQRFSWLCEASNTIERIHDTEKWIDFCWMQKPNIWLNGILYFEGYGTWYCCWWRWMLTLCRLFSPESDYDKNSKMMISIQYHKNVTLI